MQIRRICSVLAVSSVLLSTGAQATNGYFTHGVGTKNKSLAGAGTASPDESIATANNPASAVLVGSRLDFGGGVFSPRRSYESSASMAMGNGGAFTVGPNDLNSGREYFVIPYVSKVWNRGDQSAFAASFYGRGGMNSDFSGGTASFDPDSPAGPAPVFTLPGTFGGGTTGVDLSQAFLDLTYARQHGAFSWGVSAIFSAQAFEARGVGNFAGFTETFARSGGTELPTHLTDNGHDFSFGYGFKVGAIWQVNEIVALALAYQSETKMSKLDKYSDLFAGGGSFDIPSSIRAGISVAASESIKLHFDVEHSTFSDVGSVGNPIQNLFGCPTAGAGGTDFESCLGGDNGAGFGWDDVTVYKLGVEWITNAMPSWTWRAGFSTTDQPIADDQVLFNILAPAVVEQHYTFGATKVTQGGSAYSVELMYAPKNSVKGANTFDPTQTLEISMHQFELEFAYRW